MKAKLNIFETTKQLYDTVLRGNNFQVIGFFGFEIGNVPDILVSDVFLPPYDFGGTRLQSLQISSVSHVLTASLIAIPGSKGAVIFAWHKQHEATGRAFVASLRRLTTAEFRTPSVGSCFPFSKTAFYRLCGGTAYRRR